MQKMELCFVHNWAYNLKSVAIHNYLNLTSQFKPIFSECNLFKLNKLILKVL